MKISKIASLAILGISLSTSAFADLTGTVTKADKAVKTLKARESAIDTFLNSLNVINSAENRVKLKTFTDKVTDATIKAAFDAIIEIPKATLDLLTGPVTITTDTVDGKKAELKISKSSDKAYIQLGIDAATPSSQYKDLIKDGDIVTTDMATLFATDNKDVLEALVAKIKPELKKKITEQQTQVETDNKAVVAELVKENTSITTEDDIAYIMANDKKFIEIINKEENKETKKTNLKNYVKNLTAKTVAEKAKDVVGEKQTAFDDTVEPLNTAKTNYETAAKKVKSEEITLAKTAKEVKEQIGEIETLSATAASANDNTKKLTFVKKAVELGLKFNSKPSGGVAINKNNVDELKEGTGKLKDDLSTAFEQAKTVVTAQKTDAEGNIKKLEALIVVLENKQKTYDDSKKELDKATTVYNNAKSVKASLISDYLIAGADNKALAKAISGAVSNKAISEMLTDLELDKTEKAIESLATSVREVSDVIANNSVIDGVSFANNLATATRLAKLSNPFNDDLALAYAIKNIKNDSFADNSGDLVNSTIKAYTDRYNNDNNVWGTLIGAKGHIKNAGNPEFYGLSLGYDKRLDNTILGGFVSYAKSKLDTKLVSSEADNYQLGAYSRTFIDNHEIDAKASFTIAKNSLDRTSESNQKTLKQNANFDSYLFNLKADYGYVVGIDDTLFLKPTIGLEYSYAKNKEFKESGDIAFNYHGYNSSTLALNAALEIRQYVNNSNFLYFTPGVSTQLYKSNKDLVLNVVGSNVDVTLPVNSSKQTFFTLNTGADIKLTDALSTNINFGVKASNKEQYYNGTLGLKYQF